MPRPKTLNVAKARKLGAAFKKGFPPTYTRSQTKPAFRKSWHGQKRELDRLVFASGMSWKLAYGILKKKYGKAGMKFYPYREIP